MKHLSSKLMENGVSYLTNEELLSLVLNDENAAAIVYKQNGKSLRAIASRYPKEFVGITDLQRSRLVAALELSRRKQAEYIDSKIIGSSSDCVDFIKAKIEDSPVEHFMVIYLNRANRVLSYDTISFGGITGTVADPRVILKHAISNNAVSIILAHNHPSGSLRPSKLDEELTQKIKQSASYFDIKVLDHIIVSQDGYLSFTDEGIL